MNIDRQGNTTVKLTLAIKVNAKDWAEGESCDLQDIPENVRSAIAEIFAAYNDDGQKLFGNSVEITVTLNQR